MQNLPIGTFLISLLLVVTPVRAQRDLNTDGLGYTRPRFNDFAVNGTFHHDISVISVKNGIAELDSIEGQVSTPWSKLPTVFQNHNAALKAKSEAIEAAKSKSVTGQTSDAGTSGESHPPTKFIGMSTSELIRFFGKLEHTDPDPIITGCIDLVFRASSLADGRTIMIHAEMMDDVCLGTSFFKIGDNAAFTNQEIAHWMLIYSQGTKAQWKQNGPGKWSLQRGSDVPYKYRAELLLPGAFSIDTQELIERSSKAKQRAESEVQAIPGLSSTPQSNSDPVIPGLPRS